MEDAEDVRPQDYYWHTLMRLVLLRTLSRSSTYQALPRPEPDRTYLVGLGDGGLEQYTDVLNYMQEVYRADSRTIDGRELPMVCIRRLIRVVRRLVNHTIDAVGRNPQERVDWNASGSERRSYRIEARRNPWWENTSARWRAHLALMQQTVDTILNHGFPTAIEQLAHDEPAAFWDTYWHLLLFLNDPADFDDHQRALFQASDQALLEGLLCHELPHRLYPLQTAECVAALNRQVTRLRAENKEGYLLNDYVQSALASMRIDLMPTPAALGEASRQTFRDLRNQAPPYA
jgi:hypothetical protein